MIKLGELIEKLQEIQKDRGDIIEVRVMDEQNIFDDIKTCYSIECNFDYLDLRDNKRREILFVRIKEKK